MPIDLPTSGGLPVCVWRGRQEAGDGFGGATWRTWLWSQALVESAISRQKRQERESQEEITAQKRP